MRVQGTVSVASYTDASTAPQPNGDKEVNETMFTNLAIYSVLKFLSLILNTMFILDELLVFILIRTLIILPASINSLLLTTIITHL